MADKPYTQNNAEESACPPLQAHYDRRTDVLSVAVRRGEPKYVVVGRGTFVIFADERGIWRIDLEAESWDSNVDEAFPIMKVEVFPSKT